MKKRRLGKTNLEIAPIGFGGIPIQRISFEESKDVILYALDEGINFIDSARAYTDSEEKIGYALKGKRKEVILASKSGAKTYKDMKNDIRISLEKMQTDYIDLYQLHNVKTEEDYEQVFAEEGALKALVEAKAEGLIGHIGITSHNTDIALKSLKKFPFATIQFPRNFIEDQAEKELFPYARENDIGIIIMKPLAGGAIEDGELAIKYLLNYDLSVVIPGMDTKKQILENTGVAKGNFSLEDSDLEKIAKIKEELGHNFCRRCEYCKPCPKGIDIPGCFLFLGYYKRYDLKDWALDRYNSMENKASACVECGICETRCPYDLPIRDMLKDVQDNLE